MAAFAQLLVRQSALSTGDFTSVCRSLADICRGKLAPDSLNRFAAGGGVHCVSPARNFKIVRAPSGPGGPGFPIPPQRRPLHASGSQ